MNSFERTCTEQYGIDFTKKVREILPFFWEFSIQDQSQKILFMNFVEVLFNSLGQSNSNFLALCEFVRDRLSYSGQVLSLVTLLNDKFDDPLRRITLQCLNNNFIEGQDFYLNSEVDPSPFALYRNGESVTGPITLFTNAETTDSGGIFGKSFIVKVPVSVPQSDAVIRGLLDLYVIAPQLYIIQRF